MALTDNFDPFRLDISPIGDVPKETGQGLLLPYDSAKINSKKSWNDEVHLLLKNRYKYDTISRLILAYSTQATIIAWLVCIIIILMRNGNHYLLSDTVICVLLGTTTATVLGLALIVLKGFFLVMDQDVKLR